VYVPHSLVDLFDANEAKTVNSTKQLRHLESADFQLEQISICPDPPISLPTVPSLEATLTCFSHKVPIEDIHNPKTLSNVIRQMDEEEKAVYERIYEAVANSKTLGKSVEEIALSLQLPEEEVRLKLRQLCLANIIFECGIDVKRFVTIQNAKCWMLTNRQFGFFVKPWTKTSGDLDARNLRWIAEGVMFTVNYKPGILLQEIISVYSFALQPALLMEVAELLENIGCLRICSRQLTKMQKESPFAKFDKKEMVKYLLPTDTNIQRFASFFKDVSLPDHAIFRREEQSVQDSHDKP
jgi:hypothetical protein